jgi:hypothetical protein
MHAQMPYRTQSQPAPREACPRGAIRAGPGSWTGECCSPREAPTPGAQPFPRFEDELGSRHADTLTVRDSGTHRACAGYWATVTGPVSGLAGSRGSR